MILSPKAAKLCYFPVTSGLCATKSINQSINQSSVKFVVSMHAIWVCIGCGMEWRNNVVFLGSRVTPHTGHVNDSTWPAKLRESRDISSLFHIWTHWTCRVLYTTKQNSHRFCVELSQTNSVWRSTSVLVRKWRGLYANGGNMKALSLFLSHYARGRYGSPSSP